MSKLHLSFILVSALLMAGCGKKEKSAYKTPVTETYVQDASPNDALELEIQIDKSYTWPGSTDPFDIVSRSISGDTLFVVVQYGGGCKDHGFKMSTNLMWLKSKPPMLHIYLEHENNDDNCRALVNRTLAFDLKKLRNPSTGQVKLILNDNRESMVEYSYK